MSGLADEEVEKSGDDASARADVRDRPGGLSLVAIGRQGQKQQGGQRQEADSCDFTFAL